MPSFLQQARLSSFQNDDVDGLELSSVASNCIALGRIIRLPPDSDRASATRSGRGHRVGGQARAIKITRARVSDARASSGRRRRDHATRPRVAPASI
eukprot:99975-Pyramimonas_sp.AAC.1